MSTSIPAQVVPPDLRGLLNAHRNEIFSSLNCVQVGTIQSYNPATMRAKVSVNFRRTVYNKTQALDGPVPVTPNIVEYPLLGDVPVAQLYGGTALISVPVMAGDGCILLFNDRDLDIWLTTGATAEPNSARLHDMSDAIAIVGLRSAANPPPHFSNDELALWFGNAKVSVDSSGGVSLDNGNGTIISVNSSGNFSILSAHGATIGSTATGGKMTIYNGAASLGPVLDQLITALTAWHNTGGTTPDAATVLALNAVKTLVDQLLF